MRGPAPPANDPCSDPPERPRRRRDVLGAVLAGGASRRMGRDKALLAPGGGPPLAERAARSLEAVLAEVVMVVAEAGDPRFPGRTLVVDRHPGLGPLAGLEAALGAAGNRPVLVTACDLPHLTPGVVRRLLGDERMGREMAETSTARTRVAASGDRLQPLLALYAPACHAPVVAALEEGRLALFRLLEDLVVTPVAVPPAALVNLNRPRDLAALDGVDTGGEPR